MILYLILYFDISVIVLNFAINHFQTDLHSFKYSEKVRPSSQYLRSRIKQ